MTPLLKICVGTAATSLLAWGAHAMTGESHIDALEAEAQSAFERLEPAEGVELSLGRNPLSRKVTITGVTDPQERDRLIRGLADVPGIGSITFAGEADAVAPGFSDGAGEEGGEVDAATAEAIADCQEGLDEVMAGKVINFRSGSAYMPNSSLAVVDEVAAVLSECPGLAIRIEGHTDATGSAEINRAVSEERANRVAAALAERGVDEARITTEGMGSAEPVMDGTSAEANAANRRIVFEVSAGSIVQPDEEGAE